MAPGEAIDVTNPRGPFLPLDLDLGGLTALTRLELHNFPNQMRHGTCHADANLLSTDRATRSGSTQYRED